MKKEELHSYFYANVVAMLKGVLDEGGYPVSDSLSAQSYRVFQSRPAGFPHQYLRDRFLENRDVYIAFAVANSLVHVITERVNTGELIIFKENLKKVFPEEYDLALEVLKELLEKFFTVRLRAKSAVARYDGSEGRTASHGRFTKV